MRAEIVPKNCLFGSLFPVPSLNESEMKVFLLFAKINYWIIRIFPKQNMHASNAELSERNG